MLVQDLCLQRGAVLEDGDGGDVGQRPGGEDLVGVQRPGAGSEQVEGADDPVPQPHRDGVHRPEPGRQCHRPEVGPPAVRDGKVLVHGHQTGPEAVRARALLGLQLEQLHDPHRLTGGRHHPEFAFGRHNHHAGGGDVEDLHAPVGEQREQLDDVELVDQGVGQLDQGRYQQALRCH